MSVNISAVAGYAAPTNSGNLQDSVLRVCIASDDVNLAQIKQDIADMKADIEAIKDIVEDVYNSISHTIKVSIL